MLQRPLYLIGRRASIKHRKAAFVTPVKNFERQFERYGLQFSWPLAQQGGSSVSRPQMKKKYEIFSNILTRRLCPLCGLGLPKVDSRENLPPPLDKF